MPWTPSEADKRAEKLMLELKDAAEACGVQTVASLYPMYHARVFDLISQAIEQALADAPPHSITSVPNGTWEASHNGKDWAAVATADPIGFDPVIEAHEEGPGLTSLDLSTGVILPSKDDPAPKKRGRPKGSKAKKAKVAKGKKAKDAVENGADPNVVPFSGELHAGETEPEPTIDLVQ